MERLSEELLEVVLARAQVDGVSPTVRLVSKKWQRCYDRSLQELRPRKWAPGAASSSSRLFPSLRSLTTHISQNLTDADLREISNMKHLTTLRLLSCQHVTAAGITNLDCSLTALYVGNSDQLADEWLRKAADMPHLTSLDLTHASGVTNNGLRALAQSKSLRHVGLDGCWALCDEGVAELAAIDTLRSLHLQGCAMRSVVRLPKLLTSLRLGRSTLSDDGVRDIASACPALEELDLSGCDRIGDHAVTSISELRHLTRLNLSSTRITDASADHLVQKLCLVNVSLDSNKLTAVAVAALARCISLRCLSLRNVRGVTDHALEALRQLPQLRRLVLEGCKSVTDKGLEALGSIRSLQYLDVGECAVSSAAVERLSCPRLIVMD